MIIFHIIGEFISNIYYTLVPYLQTLYPFTEYVISSAEIILNIISKLLIAC